MIKLIDLLKEDNKILVPRRSPEERQKNHIIAIQKQIQQYIKDGSQGDLDLSNTPITSLPNNLKVVGGGLWLTDAKITSLPDNLQVGDDLILMDTPITSLPNNLQVKNDLYLRNTPISKKYSQEEIKQMVPGVEGNIYV